MKRQSILLAMLFIVFSLALLRVAAAEGERPWFERRTTWHSYDQFHFKVAGRSAFLVVPKDAAPGNPWVWRARFPGYHAEMDIELVAKGFRVAYVDVAGSFGSPKAVAIGDSFYEYLTTKHRLARKPALEGVSRGGLFVYNWAAKNSDKVACIYCDTPVCDFKSWPGGKGEGLGSAGAWQQCLKAFGLNEEQAMKHDKNPVDNFVTIAKAKIPILHIVSENDRVVPPKENSYLLKRRLEQRGHTLQVISVAKGTAKSNGHHFDHPDPQRVVDFIVQNAGSRDVLNLPDTGTDPNAINYQRLPTLRGEHAVVNPAALGPHANSADKIDMHHLRLNLHNYLVRHDDRFWCIWSDGPRIEDWPTQEVKYRTSEDGLDWSPAKSVTGTPQEPFAFIARGLWVRDGQLLALAAHYRGKGAFGAPEQKQLKLVAYQYDASDKRWKRLGKIYDNAINNFPPQRLKSGDWILTRRDSRFNVSVLIGGRSAIDDWQSFPVVRVGAVKGFRPDEPIFWPLADGTLFALFRDNGGSRRLFHSTSRDSGRTWGKPVLTNFPNATSKLFSMKTSRGHRVLVLNANPSTGRRELHLAISTDDRTFTRLARLDIPSPRSVPDEVARIKKKFSAGIASLQYPHVTEHDDHLLIALSRGKIQTEVFRVAMDDVDALLEHVNNKTE